MKTSEITADYFLDHWKQGKSAHDWKENAISGTTNHTNFSIRVKVQKNGISIHTKIVNDYSSWSILKRNYVMQSVRIMASLDPKFDPKKDPIIGALRSKQSSVIQKSFLPNGSWGPLPRGRLKVK